MGDFFSMDNILSGDDAAALFDDSIEVKNTQETPPDNNEEKENNLKEETDITEVKDSSELFDEIPESVGNDERHKDKEGTDSNNGSDSPKPNFYSSITDALVDDGVFPDLSEEETKQVNTPEDFRDLINKLIEAGLDEVQKRIKLALDSGVDNSIIKNYEGTLSFLDLVTPDILSEESARGEDIRKKLLQLDFMNKGYSAERATRMTNKLFESGEDIEEAKLALEENKKFFKGKYLEILDNAANEEKALKEAELKQRLQLEKDILTGSSIFGDMDIDKSTRLKVRDNILKPVYKDPNTGEFYTAIQKYKLENETEFIKNVGIIYTLTDGFKNIGNLVKNSSKKEVKKKLAELENTLNNSTRDKGGTLKYVGNSGNQSLFDSGFTIDI